jgi:hypothetical protein
MRRGVAVFALTVAAAAAAEPALAIPAFARRYQIGCFHCHDGYPKLSTFGQRFKERGFRMEEEEAFDVSTWVRTIPVIVRAEARRDFVEDQSGVNSGLLKGISAGNLGQRFSYWVDDTVALTEGEDNFSHLEPNNAWARYEVLKGERLYAKAGRMELDIPFTQVRTPHLFTYPIYAAGALSGSENLGDYQEGVELGGKLRGDLRWSAAVVRVRPAGADDASGAHVFLRARKRMDDGNRFGVFTYAGRGSRTFGTDEQRRDILRVGGDASVWWRRLNVYGLYLYGRNDTYAEDPQVDAGFVETFDGGFLQADYHFSDWLAVTLRGNFLNPPHAGGVDVDADTSVYPGMQVWILRRLKLSAQYGFQSGDSPDGGAVQIDFAF